MTTLLATLTVISALLAIGFRHLWKEAERAHRDAHERNAKLANELQYHYVFRREGQPFHPEAGTLWIVGYDGQLRKANIEPPQQREVN